MSRVGNRNTPTYDASKDLAYIEREIVSIMYVLGMDTSDINSSTFDSIVDALKGNFPFKRLEGTSVASNDALKEINILVMMNSRRLWHRWQLAKGRVNG
jgi:hypothetical protein